MGGDFSLSEGRSFSWRFSPGYFATTFYCEFWWNSKIQNVKVFSYLEPHQCQRLKPKYSNICYWQAREDGIYFNKWNDTLSAPSWHNKFPWVAQESPKINPANTFKESIQNFKAQEYTSQKAVLILSSDFGDKEKVLHQQSSTDLVDSGFHPKVSGDGLHVVNKVCPVTESKLKQVYYVTEPTEIFNPSSFLSKELSAASIWPDYHGDLSRAVSTLSIKRKESVTDLEEEFISRKRSKKIPSRSKDSPAAQHSFQTPTTNATLHLTTKRRSPRKYSAVYARNSKGNSPSKVKSVSMRSMSTSLLDESSLVEVKVDEDSDLAQAHLSVSVKVRVFIFRTF
ncbi:hypothetical protein ACET3Z_025540 [Daucus carota]